MAELKDLIVNGLSRLVGDAVYKTHTAGDNSDKIASTKYVKTAVDSMYNTSINGKFKPTLTPVSTDPAASGTASAVVTSVRQDAAGVITVSRANLPTIGSANLTIKVNGTTKGTFSANATSAVTLDITKSDLGISGAMNFKGFTTDTMTDGQTTTPTGIADPLTGDVVIDATNTEFILDASSPAKWNKFGDANSYSLKGHTHTYSTSATHKHNIPTISGGSHKHAINLTTAQTVHTHEITDNAHSHGFSGSAAHKHNIPTISGGSHAHPFSLTTAQTSHSHGITDSGHKHAFTIEKSQTNHSHSITDNGHTHSFSGSASHSHSYDKATCSYNTANEELQFSFVATNASSTTVTISGNTGSKATGITIANTSFGISNASTGNSTTGITINSGSFSVSNISTGNTSITISNVSTADTTVTVSGTTDTATAGITVKSGSFSVTNVSTGNTSITISNVSTADTTITVSGTTGTASN